ncbi:MAG: hypothetical protein WCA46_25375 [Actinocatenispora sp.]
MAHPADGVEEIVPLENPARRRRRMLRRAVLLGATAVVVVAGAVWATNAAIRSCGPIGSGVYHVHGKCVGVTDGRYVFHPALADVEGRIAAMNEKTRERPGYVTVALLDPLTPTRTSALPPAAERNRLEGAYTALRRINGGDSRRRPVQLLLATQGSPGWDTDQRDQWRVVRERLTHLTGAEEGPLVAVIGLGVSTTQTREQARSLSAAGIPMVGSVITADDLESNVVGVQQDEPIRWLYKTSPSNRHYVAALRESLKKTDAASAIRVVDSNYKRDDLFTRSLEEAFEGQLGRLSPVARFPGTRRGEENGTPSERFDIVVQEVCTEASNTRGDKLAVYFAGREVDLPDFLLALSQEVRTGICRRDGAAHSARRTPAEPIVLTAGVDLGAVLDTLGSKGQSISVTVRNAATVDPDGWSRDEETAPPGFGAFRRSFRQHFDAGHLADGGAIMVYDSFMITSQAVELAVSRKDPPTIRDMQDALSDPSLKLLGASGRIEGFTDAGLPVGKPIPVLEYAPGHRVRRVGPLCRLAAGPDELVECDPAG